MRSQRDRPTSVRTVANVKIDPERGIVMRLRGGLDIVLGPPLQLQEKLRAAAWVLRHYPTSAERAQLVYADVSAPERPAVMPRGGYAPTAGLGEHKKTKRQWLPNRSEWRMMRAGYANEAFLYRANRTRRPRRGAAV